MLAMMSNSSSVAPMKTGVLLPPPRMKSLLLSTWSYNNAAGMLVTNVAIHNRPVMRASLRGGISARRADADDPFGDDMDMPTPLGRRVRTASGVRSERGRRRTAGAAGPPRRVLGRGARPPYRPGTGAWDFRYPQSD